MTCPNCKKPVKAYTKFCLSCEKPVAIKSQKISIRPRKVLLTSIALIVLSIPTLGVAYLYFWSRWVEQSRTSLNKIEDSRRISRLQIFVANAYLLLYLNLALLILISNVTGRSGDEGGFLMVYSIASFAILFLVFAFYALVYFVVNRKIALKLKFFMESNVEHITNQNFSILAGIIFGHMYFQSKVNYWRRFVKSDSASKPTKHRNINFKIPAYALVAIVILVGALAKTDYWYAYASPINSNTAAFATNAGMTVKARSLFYSTKPVATDKVTLDKACENTKVDVLEYGCFYAKDGIPTIYVLNINDSELSAAKDVTAAHEMLHYAYAKLSDSERSDLNKILTQNRASLIASNNIQYTEAIKSYASESEDVQINETHSLLSVMPVGSITPELENYYKAYFTDNRSKLIAAEAKYNATVGAYKSNLNSSLAVIDSQGKNIDDFEATLNTQERDLARYNYIGNVGGYNSLVPIYNSNLGKYKENIATYNKNVDLYNNATTEFSNRLKGMQPQGVTVQEQEKKTPSQ